jgi:hypothetical protein
VQLSFPHDSHFPTLSSLPICQSPRFKAIFRDSPHVSNVFPSYSDHSCHYCILLSVLVDANRPKFLHSYDKLWNLTIAFSSLLINYILGFCLFQAHTFPLIFSGWLTALRSHWALSVPIRHRCCVLLRHDHWPSHTVV